MLESWRAWTIFIMSFISSIKIIKTFVSEPCIFFWVPASIAEAEAVILHGAKIFFTKGTANFINGSANLLNNDPKNLPHWIILEIWALESFIFVYILLLNAFLNFAFSLVVSNNSLGKSFPSSIFKLILKVVPALILTAVFSFFSCASVNLTFTLLYSTIYTI